jgi:amidase
VAPGRLRIAFTKRGHLARAPLHPDCAAAVDGAAKLLSELGHQVEEADLDIDVERFARDFFLLLTVDIAAGYEELSELVGHRPRRGEIETDTTLMAMIGRQQKAIESALTRDRQAETARAVSRFFQRYDVLLSPRLGRPPVRIGELSPSAPRPGCATSWRPRASASSCASPAWWPPRSAASSTSCPSRRWPTSPASRR